MKEALTFRFLTLIALFAAFAVCSTACSKDDNVDNDTRQLATAAEFFYLPVERKAANFRNVDRIFNTRKITKGSHVYPLPLAASQLTTVNYTIDNHTQYGLEDFIRRNNIAGILIIKDGEIVMERYAQGNTSQSKWTSFSVAKSITSTLIGIAVKDGVLSPDDLVTKYLPQFAGTAYDGVTVRQLMQMSSGAEWNEDYTDKSANLYRLLDGIIEGKPGNMMNLLSKLNRAAAPGTRYSYNTGETVLEGAVLSAALGGENLSSYLSRKIWATMGMEADAYWMLDAPNGQEMGGGCISMTLRDYGRFGLFFLKNGNVNGLALLPENWISEASIPAEPHLDYGKLYTFPNQTEFSYLYPCGYGYNWWSISPDPWLGWEYLDNQEFWGDRAITTPTTNFEYIRGTFSAMGVFGQYIHINPKQNMVTVIWSTWPMPDIDPYSFETLCFIEAATKALASQN